MWLTERRFAEAAILDVHGELVGARASELLPLTVRTHVAAGIRIVVVNLADVTTTDAATVRGLVAVAGSIRLTGAELRICGDLTRLSRAGLVRPAIASFRAFESVDEAVADIRAALEQRQSGARTTPLRDWLAALRERLFMTE